MLFVKRTIDDIPQTLGTKLRALRRGQAISLDLIEKSTQIRRSYLYALEHGEYNKLPAPLYTRNFIRSYARALNADENYFLELYEEECGLCDLISHMQTPRQKMKRGYLRIWNSFLKFGVLFLVLFLVIGYLGLQIRSIVAPPQIVITSPSDNILTQDASLLVSGFAEDDSVVYVNGEQVVVGTDSIFEILIDLEQGLNLITIEAERRYSKKSLIERHIVFNPESGISHVSFLQK